MSINPSNNNIKRYIIQLKKNVAFEHHFTRLQDMQDPPSFTVSHTYSPSFLNAYVATFSVDHFPTFNNHEDVDFIEEDAEHHTCDVTTTTIVPSWGLARINTANKLSSTTYSYTYDNDKEVGTDVNIYILDTGIYKEHSDFDSRAKDGFVYADGTKGDINGHGTHVSGTAGGATYGIAKNATLYEVKVLGDNGIGWTSDIIKGMDWVFSNATGSCIVNMSMSGPESKSENDAVKKLTDAGIHVVVAAGNNANDAANYSPASAPTAITTGSTDSSDTMLEDSNYGESVSILAPGGSIATMSGTSMAAPHVTGIIATLISLYGNQSPLDMFTILENLSIEGALSGLKRDTPNLLARGSLHCEASFTTNNTKTGLLGIESSFKAIICKDDSISVTDSKCITFSDNDQLASFAFDSTDSKTIKHLRVVSADNSITAYISHGSETDASASATFGGTTNANSESGDDEISYENWPVNDD
ncbi:subtilisin-like protein [Pholiota conissans]|uniref:Subtilisin-like protein n=1 Tax=Pholiota conissans TaxID=109636 RepID=A0A9P6CUJ4_9AGAR|nr:subtilisin-like protein [Pholiota conissans]